MGEQTLDERLDVLASAIVRVLDDNLGEHVTVAISRDDLVGRMKAVLVESRKALDVFSDLERELLESSIQFSVAKDNVGEFTRIEKRARRDQSPLWAIVRRSHCMNREAQWEREPRVSERTPEFKKRTRWTTREDAFAFWKDHGGSAAGPERGD